MEYIRKLLYNGFYAFEAMTVRDLDETICGFCGIVGELYCGDGNAKNCCSIHEVVIRFYHLNFNDWKLLRCTFLV